MNNIITQLQVQASSGNSWTLGEISYDHETDSEPIGFTFMVGTTPLLLNLGSIPDIVMVANLDATNDLWVDASEDMDFFPQLVVPGRGILLKPQIDYIYLQSSVGTIEAWIATTGSIAP